MCFVGGNLLLEVSHIYSAKQVHCTIVVAIRNRYESVIVTIRGHCEKCCTITTKDFKFIDFTI